MICALFRLIDGCDLKQTRANKNLYKILMQFDPLSKKSQAVWKAHFNVKGLVFKKCQKAIEITISSKNCAITNLLTDHLQRDLVSINVILRDKRYKFPQFRVAVNSV